MRMYRRRRLNSGRALISEVSAVYCAAPHSSVRRPGTYAYFGLARRSPLLGTRHRNSESRQDAWERSPGCLSHSRPPARNPRRDKSPRMKTFVSELYKTLVHEVGTSFIFGVTAAAVKGAVANDSNILIKQAQALRRGVEHAQFALVYNGVLYALTRLRVRHRLATALSFFVSAYFGGKRNGVLFGMKSGLLSLLTYLLSQAYG